jgi:MATE family multidrug resistance protein
MARKPLPLPLPRRARPSPPGPWVRRYLAIATPAVFLSAGSSCLYRYLVTQQEVRAPMICTIITAALCPLYNWLLIYR